MTVDSHASVQRRSGRGPAFSKAKVCHYNFLGFSFSFILGTKALLETLNSKWVIYYPVFLYLPLYFYNFTSILLLLYYREESSSIFITFSEPRCRLGFPKTRAFVSVNTFVQLLAAGQLARPRAYLSGYMVFSIIKLRRYMYTIVTFYLLFCRFAL